MSRFLSPEWLRELSAEAATSRSLREAAQGVSLTVGHTVTGGPQGDVEYRVCFADGRVDVLSGTGEADVTVQQSYATAVSISRGELTPAEAFAAGRLRLGGQARLLAEHREAFARLEDVFGAVRARTDY